MIIGCKICHVLRVAMSVIRVVMYLFAIILSQYFLSLVLIPAGRVSVPNAKAYVVSIGDVKSDWSRAEIAFDVPKTDHPIVIYGMKGLRLPDLEYNSLSEGPNLTWVDCQHDEEAQYVHLHGLLCGGEAPQ